LGRSGLEYPQLTVILSVARVSTSFIWMILFPLCLIVCGSFYSFVADDPVAVTGTMIIAAMAFQTYVQAEMPSVSDTQLHPPPPLMDSSSKQQGLLHVTTVPALQVPYMTAMDVWIMFNLFFLFSIMTCNYLFLTTPEHERPAVKDIIIALVTTYSACFVVYWIPTQVKQGHRMGIIAWQYLRRREVREAPNPAAGWKVQDWFRQLYLSPDFQDWFHDLTDLQLSHLRHYASLTRAGWSWGSCFTSRGSGGICALRSDAAFESEVDFLWKRWRDNESLRNSRHASNGVVGSPLAGEGLLFKLEALCREQVTTGLHTELAGLRREVELLHVLQLSAAFAEWRDALPDIRTRRDQGGAMSMNVLHHHLWEGAIERVHFCDDTGRERATWREKAKGIKLKADRRSSSFRLGWEGALGGWWFEEAMREDFAASSPQEAARRLLKLPSWRAGMGCVARPHSEQARLLANHPWNVAMFQLLEPEHALGLLRADHGRALPVYKAAHLMSQLAPWRIAQLLQQLYEDGDSGFGLKQRRGGPPCLCKVGGRGMDSAKVCSHTLLMAMRDTAATQALQCLTLHQAAGLLLMVDPATVSTCVALMLPSRAIWERELNATLVKKVEDVAALLCTMGEGGVECSRHVASVLQAGHLTKKMLSVLHPSLHCQVQLHTSTKSGVHGSSCRSNQLIVASELPCNSFLGVDYSRGGRGDGGEALFGAASLGETSDLRVISGFRFTWYAAGSSCLRHALSRQLPVASVCDIYSILWLGPNSLLANEQVPLLPGYSRIRPPPPHFPTRCLGSKLETRGRGPRHAPASLRRCGGAYPHEACPRLSGPSAHGGNYATSARKLPRRGG